MSKGQGAAAKMPAIIQMTATGAKHSICLCRLRFGDVEEPRVLPVEIARLRLGANGFLLMGGNSTVALPARNRGLRRAENRREFVLRGAAKHLRPNENGRVDRCHAAPNIHQMYEMATPLYSKCFEGRGFPAPYRAMNASIPDKSRRPAADRERGRRIKALRISRRESQAAFGDHFGVEQATVSRWEKGEPVKRQLWETMAKLAKQGVAEFFLDAHQTAVPLLSWVSAGAMQAVSHTAELGDAQMIPASGLGNGDWFALSVEGDSMDRIAPSGSVIIVNRSEKTLLPRKFYIFFEDGEATFKRYADSPPRLEPFSTNPSHETIFPGKNLTIIGRVRRVLIEI